MDEDSKDGIEVWHLILAAAGVGVAYFALTSKKEQGGGGAGGGGATLSERLHESVLNKLIEGGSSTVSTIVEDTVEVVKELTETVVDKVQDKVPKGEPRTWAETPPVIVTGIEKFNALTTRIAGTAIEATGGALLPGGILADAKSGFHTAITPLPVKVAQKVFKDMRSEGPVAAIKADISKPLNSLRSIFGMTKVGRVGGWLSGSLLGKATSRVSSESLAPKWGPLAPAVGVPSFVSSVSKVAKGASSKRAPTSQQTVRSDVRVGSVTSITPMSEGRVRRTYKLGKGGLGKVSSVSYR